MRGRPNREKRNFPDLVKAVVNLKRQWSPNWVLVEDAGSGISAIQELRRLGIPVAAIKPVNDKLTRLTAQTAKIEGGLVHIPTAAPWLEAFVVEILAFPAGRHDDQVDSVSQALAWHSNRPQARSGAFGTPIGSPN